MINHSVTCNTKPVHDLAGFQHFSQRVLFVGVAEGEGGIGLRDVINLDGR
jgi:hypothetical protein